ncbi:hypothetical protein DO73_4669 [Burkholderia pseudomallei]|nr:hypothetical protein DO73_4669 [Burkholderia pseudomallei]
MGGGAAVARVKPVGDMGRVRTSGPARALLVFWKRSAYEFPGALSTRLADGLTADRGSLWRAVHGDARVAEQHDLPCADLAGLAQLDRAVDLHGARRDDHLRRAAAVREPRELQQVMQFDEFAGQREIEIGHGVGNESARAEKARETLKRVAWRRHRIISDARRARCKARVKCCPDFARFGALLVSECVELVSK